MNIVVVGNLILMCGYTYVDGGGVVGSAVVDQVGECRCDRLEIDASYSCICREFLITSCTLDICRDQSCEV
jgi:hypothetical protein